MTIFCSEIEKRQRMANGAESVNIEYKTTTLFLTMLVEMLPPVGK